MMLFSGTQNAHGDDARREGIVLIIVDDQAELVISGHDLFRVPDTS
jgi:hypothetical protein